MRHIVYCWEMGGGLGHIVAMAKIVQSMMDQGYKVTCVLNDLTHASRLLGSLGAQWLAAPRVRAAVRLASPMNHADALYNAGYDNQFSLHSLLMTWRTMFSMLRPDRVVCDYAPTARLAARSLHIETVCIDSGFSMPPVPGNMHDPLPLVRISAAPDQSRLMESERRVLDVVNQALGMIQSNQMETFSCLFKEKVWYRNWTGLNHFGPHSPELHLGQLFSDGGGVDPVWTAGAQPKVFAYLKPEHPASLKLLSAVLARGYRVLAYLPGFSKEGLHPLLESGRLVASPKPVNLNKLPDDVEIGIWHSPTGGIARCLQKGMRMLFLPMNSEQNLAATAAKRSGLPVHVYGDFETDDEMFDAVRMASRVMCDEAWASADPADFAHKLACC